MTVSKSITEMTRKEFEALPYREKWNKDVICRSIVILPLRKLHESKWRCMDYVAISEKGEPICRLSGRSDSLALDGIGGLGYRYRKFTSNPQFPVAGWRIDCLRTSGLLHLVPGYRAVIVATEDLSSFEVFSVNKQTTEAGQ